MLEDPSRFLKILKRSLKDPSRPFKIFKDPRKDLNEDPQKSLPRSLQILKNLAKIFKDLAKIFEDL